MCFMTDIHHFLRTRRSVRRFKPDPVPAPVMERILATATFAPSAHNLQPWRFVQVESALAKQKLGNALTEKMRTDMDAEGADPAQIQKRIEISLRRINEAPVIILLCRDENIIRENKPEDITIATQSVALAGLQLLLAAHAEGLSGNWICWTLYAQKSVQIAIDLPPTWLPEAMFFLGYPDETPSEPIRQPVKDLTIYR